MFYIKKKELYTHICSSDFFVPFFKSLAASQLMIPLDSFKKNYIYLTHDLNFKISRKLSELTPSAQTTEIGSRYQHGMQFGAVSLHSYYRSLGWVQFYSLVITELQHNPWSD